MEAVCSECGFRLITRDAALVEVRHVVMDARVLHEVILTDPITVTTLSSEVVLKDEDA